MFELLVSAREHMELVESGWLEKDGNRYIYVGTQTQMPTDADEIVVIVEIEN